MDMRERRIPLRNVMHERDRIIHHRYIREPETGHSDGDETIWYQNQVEYLFSVFTINIIID